MKAEKVRKMKTANRRSRETPHTRRMALLPTTTTELVSPPILR